MIFAIWFFSLSFQPNASVYRALRSRSQMAQHSETDFHWGSIIISDTYFFFFHAHSYSDSAAVRRVYHGYTLFVEYTLADVTDEVWMMLYRTNRCKYFVIPCTHTAPPNGDLLALFRLKQELFESLAEWRFCVYDFPSGVLSSETSCWMCRNRASMWTMSFEIGSMPTARMCQLTEKCTILVVLLCNMNISHCFWIAHFQASRGWMKFFIQWFFYFFVFWVESNFEKCFAVDSNRLRVKLELKICTKWNFLEKKIHFRSTDRKFLLKIIMKIQNWTKVDSFLKTSNF